MKVHPANTVIAWLLGLTTLVLGGPALATAIPIANASFEAQVLADGAGTNNVVTNWVDTTGCSPSCFGVFNPNVGNAAYPGGAVPDGNNAAYMVSLSNVPLTQTLTATLAANTTYTLTVAVGNPADRPDSLSFGFELGLVGSSQNIIAFTALNSTIPNGSFVDRSASATVAASNLDIGKTLIVRLYGPNNACPTCASTEFDNVRLDATVVAVPEPGQMAMLVSGLLLLGLRVRQSRPSHMA